MAAKGDSSSKPFAKTSSKTGNWQSGSMETTQEMAPELMFKMSKKIAQLTKVIYALNTKNDDYEEIVESLKTSHEEEIRKVLKESSLKVAECKQKLTVLTDIESTVSTLRSSLKDSRKEKDDAVTELSQLKLSMEDYKKSLEEEYVAKFDRASKSLVEARNTLQERTNNFENECRKLKDENNTRLREIGHSHALELENLMKAHRIRYDEQERGLQSLRDELNNYKEHGSKIGNQFESQRNDLLQECDKKLEKLKALHEREIEVLNTTHKNTMTTINDERTRLEKDLRNEICNLETELKRKEKYMEDSKESKDDEIKSLNSQITDLTEKLTSQEKEHSLVKGEQSSLTRKLMDKCKEVDDLNNTLRSTKDQLKENERVLQLKEEMITSIKSELTSYSTNEQKYIKDVDDLKHQLEDLKSENVKLRGNQDYLNTKSLKEIDMLRKNVLEKEEEAKKLIESHTKEVSLLKQKQSEEMETVKKDHAEFVVKLKNDHTASYEELTKRLTLEYEGQRSVLKKSYERDKENIVKEKDTTIENLSKDIEEKQLSVERTESEIRRLQQLIMERDKGLESGQKENVHLNSELEALRKEHAKYSIEYKSACERIKTLQENYEELKAKHTSEMEEAIKKQKTSLESLRKEMELTWSERLRNELEAVRTKMTSTHDTDKRDSLKKLQEIKEKEHYEMKKELEGEIIDLQNIVARLRTELDKTKEEHAQNNDSLHREIDDIRKSYEQKLSSEVLTHTIMVSEIQDAHAKRVKEMSDEHKIQIEELETKLRSQHQADLTFQIQAGKIALEAARTESEEKYTALLNDLQMKHKIEKDALREALYLQQQEEIEQVTKDHDSKMEGAKKQLERSIELRTKEFEVHSKKIEELMASIKEKETQIEDSEKEIKRRDDNILQLNRELETKVEEIRLVRRECNNLWRKKEQMLAKAHRDEVDSLTADHLREQQKHLAEFGRSRELLQEKITALQLMLEAAEEKYRNRESRHEDLELIEELKKYCKDREYECQRVNEEKRYFQLELMNRETNFNKVFNSNPNVGVINPLDANKRKKKVKEAWNSAGTMRSSQSLNREGTPPRLEPLANSHVHEQRLNSSKPLPGSRLT